MPNLLTMGRFDNAPSLRDWLSRAERNALWSLREASARVWRSQPMAPRRRSVRLVVGNRQAPMSLRLRSLVLLAVVLLAGLFASSPSLAAASCAPLLNHSFPALQDSRPQSLCQWQGKVLLVVNTASYCGFTSQYDGLEKLYARLKDRGLVVVGFPSNDFGAQEPGSNQEIAEFCRLTYGVEFPMLGKTVVRGADANPFYRALAKATGSSPQWNFHKYLIDRDGRRVVAFPSATRPDDPALVQKIDEFLH